MNSVDIIMYETTTAALSVKNGIRILTSFVCYDEESIYIL